MKDSKPGSSQTACSGPLGNLSFLVKFTGLPSSFRINGRLLAISSPGHGLLALTPFPASSPGLLPSTLTPDHPGLFTSLTHASHCLLQVFWMSAPSLSGKLLSRCEKHSCHLFSPGHGRDLAIISIPDAGSDICFALARNVPQTQTSSPCTNEKVLAGDKNPLNLTVLGLGRAF